jgi:hypothetical protein
LPNIIHKFLLKLYCNMYLDKAKYKDIKKKLNKKNCFLVDFLFYIKI